MILIKINHKKEKQISRELAKEQLKNLIKGLKNENRTKRKGGSAHIR
jgi:hypothetical protein